MGMNPEWQQASEEFAEQIRERFPSCPESTVIAIAQHACEPGTGRVGTSQTAEDPVRAAVVAHIRHQYTGYEDDLFLRRNRDWARDQIRDLINDTLRQWAEPPRKNRRG